MEHGLNGPKKGLKFILSIDQKLLNNGLKLTKNRELVQDKYEQKLKVYAKNG